MNQDSAPNQAANDIETEDPVRSPSRGEDKLIESPGIVSEVRLEDSYLQYIPRIEDDIRTLGLLQVPRSILEKEAMLGIPNDRGESFDGHSSAVGSMTSEFAEGLNQRSIDHRISSRERAKLVTAARFHDVGKIGGRESINPNPIPFVKLYNINFPFKPQDTLFRKALDYAVKTGGITENDREYIKEVIRKKGHNPDKITLRTFYNFHPLDTYDILIEAGVDEPLARMAASHHLKRGLVPNGYSAEELAHETRGCIEIVDEAIAMRRKGNPKEKIPMEAMLKEIRTPFEEMGDRVGRIYCDTIRAGVASEVLPVILEKYREQRN